MSIAQGFIMELEHEGGVTRRSIERVPDEKLDYRPHAKSMTMRRLVGHLCETPGWGLMMVNDDVFDHNPDEYKPLEPATVAEALAQYDEGVAALKGALEGKDDAHMMDTWKMTVKGEPRMEMPRAAVVRNFLINHQIHHRAQLGVYLRLNDIPLPAIYGPSADEGSM